MATFWSVLTLAGVWGFALCTVALILKGFPARGVFERRPALFWGGGSLLCFIAWMVGMAHA